VFGCTLAALGVAAQDTSAGSKYFVAARNEMKNRAETEAAASAEKGWSAVLAAGPARPGFIECAYDASNIFLTVGRALRAEAVYKEGNRGVPIRHYNASGYLCSTCRRTI
jgi:hypothetical protein